MTGDSPGPRRAWFERMASDLSLPAGYALPHAYEIDEAGVHHDGRRLITAPLVLTRVLIDPSGLHLVELAWRDRGRWVRRVVPRSAIVSGKAMVTALADAGLPVIASGAVPAEKYVAALEATNRSVLEPVLIARCLGWQDDGTFVHAQNSPRQVEPAYPEQAAALAAHRERGTLSGWQDAVKPLVAYPVAQMVLCAGFAAALLDVLRLDSHTVDVSGRSSRGKTTSAKITFSLWGDPSERADGIFSWRTTEIAIEQRLNLVRGLPVVLDETRVASSPELVDKVLYQVPKNHGKARGGSWPSLLAWQTIVISTGEQSALSHTAHQGAAARVLSVTQPPFPPGGTAGADARAVGEGISDHYGHAGPLFVGRLIAVLQDGGAEYLRQRHADLTGELQGANDMAARRAPALAAHVLAGQLAQEWGVLPFEPPTITQWLDAFQGEDETDDRGEMALNVVREYVASNGHRLWKPGGHAGSAPHNGWIGRLHDHEGTLTVGLLPGHLREALERAGYVLPAVLPSWQESGAVLRLGDGRTPFLANRRCGESNARMYIFAPNLIGIGDDHAE